LATVELKRQKETILLEKKEKKEGRMGAKVTTSLNESSLPSATRVLERFGKPLRIPSRTSGRASPGEELEPNGLVDVVGGVQA
jgi:hypothetical protein